MEQKAILNGIALLFILFGISAIANSFYNQNPFQIFWGCYLGCLLLGIGILTRNGTLVGAQLCVLGVPVLVWNIDFFYRIFTGNFLFGFTGYFFTSGFEFGKLITLQHLFILPLGFFALAQIKTKEFNFVRIGLVQILLLFIPIYFLTTPLQDINCVFRLCGLFDLGAKNSAIWFIGYLTLMTLTNKGIIYLDRKYKIFSN